MVVQYSYVPKQLMLLPTLFPFSHVGTYVTSASTRLISSVQGLHTRVSRQRHGEGQLFSLLIPPLAGFYTEGGRYIPPDIFPNLITTCTLNIYIHILIQFHFLHLENHCQIKLNNKNKGKQSKLYMLRNT